MSNFKQSKEDLEAALHWRRKHAQAIRALDAGKDREAALQQRVAAAEDLLRRSRAVIEGGGWSDLERDIAEFFKKAGESS